MTTITKIEPKTYQGKVTGHSVVLSDGTSGYLNDKGSSPELKVGDSVISTLEVKKNKKGEDYNLLTLQKYGGTPATPQPSAPSTTPPKVDSNNEIRRMKFDSRMQLVKVTHDVLIAGVFKDDEAKEHLLTWSSLVDGLIDELFK